jgi:hypothetical protein
MCAAELHEGGCIIYVKQSIYAVVVVKKIIKIPTVKSLNNDYITL